MKKLILTTALALFAAPALAETKWQWGCEWKVAENGNYLTKVDGGCAHWVGLGYATQAEYLKSPKADATDDEGEEPGGEGPGDEGGEGPGDGGDTGAGPGDGGNDNPGADDNGGDKPSKGKGRGKGKGKGGRGQR